MVEAAMDDVGFGEAVGSGNVERDVDAADFEVAPDVLPEIGELECGTGGVGEALARLVAITAEVEDETADGISRVHAIVDDRIPVGIALHRLVLTKGFQKVGEVLLGDVLGDDGFAKRDENRMRRISVVAGV